MIVGAPPSAVGAHGHCMMGDTCGGAHIREAGSRPGGLLGVATSHAAMVILRLGR
ncbi:MAG: hypothetical protein KatS3mg116_3550 [Elioraea sp.]|nr:MAG: hypothetical protein KatS3mg116_3550 [Elioraea sp.]